MLYNAAQCCLPKQSNSTPFSLNGLKSLVTALSFVEILCADVKETVDRSKQGDFDQSVSTKHFLTKQDIRI